jgi:DNA ligase-4
MLGLNDDLDLLVIGGYYGTGKRSGLLSHFLLGVSVDADKSGRVDGQDDVCGSNSEPKLFYSVCKIGSGYTMKELSDFNRKLMNKWKTFDKKDPPKHLMLAYEKPEVWIEPKDSFIVQVKAVEIVHSDKYKTGVTLRYLQSWLVHFTLLYHLSCFINCDLMHFVLFADSHDWKGFAMTRHGLSA